MISASHSTPRTSPHSSAAAPLAAASSATALSVTVSTATTSNTLSSSSSTDYDNLLSEPSNNSGKDEERLEVIPKHLFDVLQKLITAMSKGHMNVVLEQLKLVPDLNVIIPNVNHVAEEKKTGSLIPLHSKTLLSTAVINLQYDIVKLLLDQGANPNVRLHDNQSLIEILLSGLGLIALDEALGKKLRIKLFNQGLPFYKKIELTRNDIDCAERILDLLLCYGIHTDFEYTEFFERSLHLLKEAGYFQMRGRSHLFAKPNIKKSETEDQMPKGAKRFLVANTHYYRHKIHSFFKEKMYFSPIIVNTLDFINTCILLPSDIQQIGAQIKEEKNKLLKQYLDAMHNLIQTERGWPDDLSKIVLQYAGQTSHEVAQARQSCALRFWKKYDHQQTLDRMTQRNIKYYEYDKATQYIKEKIGEELQYNVLKFLLGENNIYQKSFEHDCPVKTSTI